MKQVISKILKEALKEEKVDWKPEQFEKLIEVPPSPEMGDFAFPCFAVANVLKMPPHEAALNIRANIKNQKDFADIQTKGPYINFFLDRKAMAINLMKEISKQGDKFGSSDIGRGKKVLIEHTSINPNASPHVGRVRNAVIGDSLVRIHKFVNFKPEVHYFVNDVSKQIAMLVLAKAEKLKFEHMLKKYSEVSKRVAKSKKVEQKVFDLLFKFEQGDKDVARKFKKVVDTCVKGQAKILAELGIKYDYFDYESKYLKESPKILAELEKTKRLFKDEFNRMVLDLKGTSIEGKMKSPVLVLTRNDGTGLYPLRDLAYTKDKLKKAKENIIVLGEDHKLYFQQIKETLKLLESPAPEAIHYSFILISEKGKSKKMSTRKGDVVLLEDFLEKAISKAKKEIDKRKTRGDPKKVGVGAVKYSILKNNNNKIIHFNLEDALAFEGDTGPYLLYSYARANSILKKAKVKKQVAINFQEDLESHETNLIIKLSQFTEVVQKSYNQLNPSAIANYSYQLAQIFNEFYHACPVIGSEKQTFRLALVESFKQVLKNSLNLLGIETLEKM